MGELADAIREHLELKRRRGADPVEVAREEQEALTPVTRSHPIVGALPDEPGTEHEIEHSAAANGDAAHEEYVGDATQEFRVELQDEEWLEDAEQA